MGRHRPPVGPESSRGGAGDNIAEGANARKRRRPCKGDDEVFIAGFAAGRAPRPSPRSRPCPCATPAAAEASHASPSRYMPDEAPRSLTTRADAWLRSARGPSRSLPSASMTANTATASPPPRRCFRRSSLPSRRGVRASAPRPRGALQRQPSRAGRPRSPVGRRNTMTTPNKRLDDLAKADTAEGRLGMPKAVEAQQHGLRRMAAAPPRGRGPARRASAR